MSMKSLEMIREMLCDELDEIAEKGELSAGTLDTVDKITHTVKNLDKIIECEEEKGYSRAGEWNAAGRYSRRGYSRRPMYEQERGRESNPMVYEDAYSYRNMR